MAYLSTNFFEGGTADQYLAILGATHSDGAMPNGQKHHFSSPTEGGWLVVTVWDSKESCDHFTSETPVPALRQVSGGFTSIPQRHNVDDVDISFAPQ